MAKKVVATFGAKQAAKQYTKIVRSVKNPETGAYTFKEDIIPSEQVQDFLKNSK
ncbi:MAG: DUF4295 domain-containing protein [Bacteroidia bacterium]|nr:DUF4295 domain-containing protein [Bacteroidia bacterium]